MKRINKLSQKFILELEKAFKDEKHAKQKIIYQAIWLLAKGWEIEKVSEVVGLSVDRIRQLITNYHKKGLVGLRLKPYPGNNHVLTRQQKEHIREIITNKTSTGWTINLLKLLVEKEFNISYKDQDSYRRLLIWCGFSFHKASQLWFV